MAGKSKTPIIFTQEESEFIDGALLGDGHITKPKGNSSQFSYITSKRGHAEYVYNKLKRLIVKECVNGPIKCKTYDARTKKTYTSYRVRSISNITFFNLRHRWYPEGIKIIPSDVKLTSSTMLIWYLGDGSLMDAKRSFYIKLCTNGFDKNNVESVLFPQLEKYRPSFIEAKENQYWIYIPRKNIRSFLSYIGECPFFEYQYKWNLPEYKRLKFKNGIAVNFSLIKNQILTEYKNGVSMWNIHKKFNVDYNLIKYHLKKLCKTTSVTE